MNQGKWAQPIATLAQAITFLESLIPAKPRPYALRAAYAQKTISRLLDRIHNPHRRLQVIHIAGSKGKGSTALLAEAILRAAGKRVGTFTSPHLQRWNERFRINGRDVADSSLTMALEHLRPHIQALSAEYSDQSPSFFDTATAAAFFLFQSADVDYAIIEAGLGGRSDATNVVQPAVTCITSIELEHTDRLGKTLAAIASEKAGIIKSGIPVISGFLPPSAVQVIDTQARAVGAPLIRLGRELQLTTRRGKEMTMALTIDSGNGPIHAMLPVLGRHLAVNGALAVACIQQLGVLSPAELAAATRQGFANIRLPGRMEIWSRCPWVVVDAAHTPASARALALLLAEIPAKVRHLVLSISVGKDLKAICKALLPTIETVTVTQAEPIRSQHPEILADEIRALFPHILLRVIPDPRLAIKSAYETLPPHTALCITGSVYMAGLARTVLTEITLPSSPTSASIPAIP